MTYRVLRAITHQTKPTAPPTIDEDGNYVRAKVKSKTFAPGEYSDTKLRGLNLDELVASGVIEFVEEEADDAR